MVQSVGFSEFDPESWLLATWTTGAFGTRNTFQSVWEATIEPSVLKVYGIILPFCKNYNFVWFLLSLGAEQ